MLHTQPPSERDGRFVTHEPTGTAHRRWALAIVLLPLAALLAGCQHELSPTGPVQDEQPLIASRAEVAEAPPGLTARQAPPGPITAAIALEDALVRVLPTLDAGGSTAALDAGLRQLHAQLEAGGLGSRGLARALIEVQTAVDRYQMRAGEEFQPDLSVLQLALDAVAQM